MTLRTMGLVRGGGWLGLTGAILAGALAAAAPVSHTQPDLTGLFDDATPEGTLRAWVLPDRSVRVAFATLPGRTYRVQTATCVVNGPTEWTTMLTSYAGTNRVLWFDDREAPNCPQRFFRVAEPAVMETLPPFAKGFMVRWWVDLNGNNIRMDSFDSSDPTSSTNGLYYGPWARDNGDVASAAGVIDRPNVNVGNARILGSVATGPGGGVALGPNGVVGSRAWHVGGQQGLEPGHATDGVAFRFDQVHPPFSSGYVVPSSGEVDGTRYTYVLGTGNYLLPADVDLSGRSAVLVNGRCVWWVQGNFSMSGGARVVIAPNASLFLYVGQSAGSATECRIAGDGIVNGTGRAMNCLVFGLPSTKSMLLRCAQQFTGAIYAPDADMAVNGTAEDHIDYCGAGFFSTLRVVGHCNFHYDEALRLEGLDPMLLGSQND